MLALISGESDARDWFVDALTDPQLGPRAAVPLVKLGALHIPAVRTVLEETVARGTRMSDVYGALAEIHYQEVLRLTEAVRAADRRKLRQSPLRQVRTAEVEPTPTRYFEGATAGVRYQLLSDSSSTPHVQSIVAPHYPSELIAQKLSGEVVIDLQLTDEGEVAGIWLISSTPDIFASLATAAVRQWRFDAIPAKIRVVLAFTP
jgi:TonB family protein